MNKEHGFDKYFNVSTLKFDDDTFAVDSKDVAKHKVYRLDRLVYDKDSSKIEVNCTTYDIWRFLENQKELFKEENITIGKLHELLYIPKSEFERIIEDNIGLVIKNYKSRISTLLKADYGGIVQNVTKVQ